MSSGETVDIRHMLLDFVKKYEYESQEYQDPNR